MTLLVANLDRAAAGHLAIAIKLHRRTLDRNGTSCPSALIDLQHLALEVGRGSDQDASGHQGTPRDENDADDCRPLTVEHMDCGLLSQGEVAARLGVNPRTVRRWLDRGVLRSVGPRRQIPVRELNRLAGARADAR